MTKESVYTCSNMLTDEYLISCHRDEAVWEQSGLCSICSSLHPDDFIDALQHGEFVSGWHWHNGKPLYCETARGRFYAAHLTDMTEEWLYTKMPIIVGITGTFFVWNGRERFCWVSNYPNKALKAGHIVDRSFIKEALQACILLIELRRKK